MSHPAKDHDASASNSNAALRHDAQVSRKWTQAVSSRLAREPLKTISDALNKDESVASRIRSGETKLTFNEALELIAALGMKCVAAGSVCVAPDKYQAIATIAQAAMADEEISRKLIWEQE